MNKEFAESKCRYCRKEYENYNKGVQMATSDLFDYVAEIAEKGLRYDEYESKLNLIINHIVEFAGESALWWDGYEKWLKEIQK